MSTEMRDVVTSTRAVGMNRRVSHPPEAIAIARELTVFYETSAPAQADGLRRLVQLMEGGHPNIPEIAYELVPYADRVVPSRSGLVRRLISRALASASQLIARRCVRLHTLLDTRPSEANSARAAR